jgi:peptidoglycan lytic transglycosylase
VVRLSAAVCGVAIMFACSSAAMAHNLAGHDASIVGTAYPYRPGYREGGPETSSGERYDPSAWTAAIQTDLRKKFGGAHGGKARYALVEGGNKKVIVKINDVGPLEPGRIIDLNERAMRYFDSTLQRGLIRDVKVTPLRGDRWTPGPMAEKVTASAGTD